MPRKNIVEKQSTWVPFVARCLCYHCGVSLQTDEDKNHCRMCGDIFCVNCWGSLVQLSPEYGYGAIPQPVCVTCALVLKSFPTFTARLSQQGGGQLLPPQHAVIVVADSRTNGTSLGESATASEKGSSNKSIFGRLFSSNSQDKDLDKEGGDRASLRRSSVSPANKHRNSGSGFEKTNGAKEIAVLSHQRFPIQPEHASHLSLCCWRPMNPSTILSCTGKGGLVNISLKSIKSIEYQNNEKIVITVVDEDAGGIETDANGRVNPATLPLAVVHLVVGFLEEDAEEDASHKVPANPQPSFTFDATATQSLATSLNGLLRHVKAHFAFSQASMALHPDLCPGGRKTTPKKETTIKQ